MSYLKAVVTAVLESTSTAPLLILCCSWWNFCRLNIEWASKRWVLTAICDKNLHVPCTTHSSTYRYRKMLFDIQIKTPRKFPKLKTLCLATSISDGAPIAPCLSRRGVVARSGNVSQKASLRLDRSTGAYFWGNGAGWKTCTFRKMVIEDSLVRWWIYIPSMF